VNSPNPNYNVDSYPQDRDPNVVSIEMEKLPYSENKNGHQNEPTNGEVVNSPNPNYNYSPDAPIDNDNQPKAAYPVEIPRDVAAQLNHSRTKTFLMRIFPKIGSSETQGFIVKVYSLLTIQLMITGVFVFFFMLLRKLTAVHAS